MKQLGYNDIALKPKKCIVDSRKECNTSVKIGNRVFDMPICAANMKSVINIETCKFFARKNWFYIMHRFDIDIFDFIYEMQKENLYTSISIGINEDSYETLRVIYNEPLVVDYITIDVANAWSDKTHKMVDYINKHFPESFLIVGNVATGEAVEDIEKWCVDAIKIGIAGGCVCLSKNKTGVFRPMVSTIEECSSAVKNALIIADGGIKEHGDIAKSISVGSDLCMAGSLFAGYDQSSGNIIEINETSIGKSGMYKEYFGSASKYNKNECKNIEGKKILVQYKGDMTRLLEELKEDLQSSISYVGGKSLRDLRYADHYLI
jgi:GMP reductase